MSYSDSQTFNLEKLGAPEIWVTYSRPGLLPFKQGEEFMKKHQRLKLVRMGQESERTMEDILTDTRAEFDWVMHLIEDWNIPYHSSHKKAGEIIPIPNNDPSSMEEVPGYYLSYIVATIKKDPTGADFLAQGVLSSISTTVPSSTEELQTENDSNG